MRGGPPGGAESAGQDVVLQVVGHIPAIAHGREQGPVDEFGKQVTYFGVRQLWLPKSPGSGAGERAAPGEYRQLRLPSLAGLGQVGDPGLDPGEQRPVRVGRVQIRSHPGHPGHVQLDPRARAGSATARKSQPGRLNRAVKGYLLPHRDVRC